MTLAELPGWAADMLVRERVARVGFRDGDGLPRVLPMTFALAEDQIWSVIDHKPKQRPEPARIRWLRSRPQAALVVDVYDDDWTKLAWVQVLGRFAVLSVEDAPSALDALAAKYVPYSERRPPGPLLRLDTRRVLYWRALDANAPHGA